MITPDYYAVIHPKSKYANQCDGKPFPVKLQPAGDGYHWNGNKNIYRDEDLVLLYPVEDPGTMSSSYLSDSGHLIYDDEPEPTLEQKMERYNWFIPVKNRNFVDVAFELINRNGQQLPCRGIEHIHAA